jgi:hypothetical protein
MATSINRVFSARVIAICEAIDGSNAYWVMTLKNPTVTGTTFSATLVGNPAQTDDAGLAARLKATFNL